MPGGEDEGGGGGDEEGGGGEDEGGRRVPPRRAQGRDRRSRSPPRVVEVSGMNRAQLVQRLNQLGVEFDEDADEDILQKTLIYYSDKDNVQHILDVAEAERKVQNANERRNLMWKVIGALATVVITGMTSPASWFVQIKAYATMLPAVKDDIKKVAPEFVELIGEVAKEGVYNAGEALTGSLYNLVYGGYVGLFGDGGDDTPRAALPESNSTVAANQNALNMTLPAPSPSPSPTPSPSPPTPSPAPLPSPPPLTKKQQERIERIKRSFGINAHLDLLSPRPLLGSQCVHPLSSAHYAHYM